MSVTWSGLGRSADVVLAVWPHYEPISQHWLMQELIDQPYRSPTWRQRLVQGANDRVFADHYADRKTALLAAEKYNQTLRQDLEARTIDPVARQSLELKVSKALQSKQRLQEEEALMLAESMRRHAQAERPGREKLKLSPKSEGYRNDLAEQLKSMPYLKVAMVGWADGRWGRVLLYLGPENVWSDPYIAGKKAALSAERAKIANGFGLSGRAHWGETKARIREKLLPRANQLLQLASVQRMLAEAFARGDRVLVSNGVVFWYEADGNIGWQVKSVSSTKESEGATVWKEGTIFSSNHGRLVILPYIKENGDKVRGHTRNAPNDGRSLPRHPDQCVEIPFSMLDGDLMIGLFGELPYE